MQTRKRRRMLTRAREQEQELSPSPETSTAATSNSLSELPSWPDIDPTEKRWPGKSLLCGLDDEIWRAMGYNVDPTAFNEHIGQQVAIRQAHTCNVSDDKGALDVVKDNDRVTSIEMSVENCISMSYSCIH